MSKANAFPDLIRAFFYEWLVEQRNPSIRSYRDTWRLFLRFVAQRTKKKVAVLCQEGAKAPCCTRDEGGPFGAAL
jgi:hypothetical protein